MTVRSFLADLFADVFGGPPNWVVVDDQGGGDDSICAVPEDRYEPHCDELLARDLRRGEAFRLARRLRKEREV